MPLSADGGLSPVNYKLLIQYDGTDLHGWQVQENDRTVQGELERVIATLEDAPVKVIGSGRTDAGVHAEGQVANVRLDRPMAPERLLAAINGNLWRDIRVMNAERAPDDFHARYSAKGKTYLYRIVNAPVMSPFWRRYALHEYRPLDIAKMNEAARLFLGEHDWTTFASAQSEGESRVREIFDCVFESKWDRSGGSVIEFYISGSGFLRYMVRSIVGTLLEVGRGERDAASIQEAILARDRTASGRTAPPQGLTLLKVDY